MATTKNSPDKVPHFIDLFLFANSTKRTRRSGWLREKIENSESLAEHIFSLSFLALQLGTELSERLQYPLNKGKLVKMALIHDIGELATGDIVTSRGTIIDQQRLKAKETEQKASIKKLFKKTDPSNFSLVLFQELIDRKTLESQLLWQLDKLDMALQALEYEIAHKKDLSEFFENAKANISDEFLKELLEETIKRRPKSSR